MEPAQRRVPCWNKIILKYLTEAMIPCENKIILKNFKML